MKIIPELKTKGNWQSLLAGRQKERFVKQILPGYLKTCRWFGAKAHTIRKINIVEDAPIHSNSSPSRLLLLEVSYNEELPELYLLPLSFVLKSQSTRILDEFPQGIIAHLRVGEKEGIIYDSVYDEEFHQVLLLAIARGGKIKGKKGEFLAYRGKKLQSLLRGKKVPLASEPLKVEQSNSSIIYENRLFLKLYRRLDEGINPELEIIRFLTEKTNFSSIPPFAGAIEYRRPGRTEPITVALLQGAVENLSDAYTYTLEATARYFKRVLSQRRESEKVPDEYPSLREADVSLIPPLMQELIGGVYLGMATLLGKRTGELHLALGSLSEEKDFAPEPLSVKYQQAWYQSMQSLVLRTLKSLKINLKKIPENIRPEARAVLTAEKEILNRMQKISQKKISATKIRIHGDYHLGQVLYTGKDFVIIDFEGEPARALNERRLKHSPFKDVAGMIRSFHYAAYGTLFLNPSFRPEDIALLEPWINPWYHYTRNIFLSSYLKTVGDAPFVPEERNELEILLQTFLLEKAVYELGYELNNRPDWLVIPLKGIESILKNSP